MSKTFRCRVKKDITISVDCHERVDYQIGLSHTLPRQNTDEILRQVLEELGGETRDDGTVVLQIGESVVLEVDPSARTATAHARERGRVEVSVDRTESVLNMHDDENSARREAERRVDDSIRDQVDRETLDEVRSRLGAASRRVVTVLRELRDRTEREAILRKAACLGTIENVVEETDEATGARSITIELRLAD